MMTVRSGSKASAGRIWRSVVACGLASLAVGSASFADTLLQWDIGQSLSSTAGTTNGSLPINGAGVIGISGAEITVLGSANGTRSSEGWRWYDGTPRPTDLDGALANSNYFEWSVTTNAFTTATISGLGSTSFRKGSSAPNTLGLVYSPDPVFSTYRVVSAATAIPGSTATDLAAGLAGDLDTVPVVLAPDSTGYFRLAYWGATSFRSGAIWIGNSANGNDFSFTGSFESSVVQRTLSWNGVAGAAGSTWNTSPANTVWLDGTTATGFSPIDNAVFPAASDVVVDPAGVTASTVVVSNEAGVVSIGGGSVAASSLSKVGAGRLVLSGSHSFTTGSTISAGVVQLESEAALGDSAATFTGSTLAVGNGVATIATPLVAGSGGLTLENTATVTVSAAVLAAGPVTETRFLKTGAGTLELTGGFGVQNTAPLELDVAEGSLTLRGSQKNVGGTSDWNGAVSLDGGTLMLHGGVVTGTGIVTNVNPASAIFARLNRGDARFENSLVLNESLTINSPNGRNLLVMAGPISGAGGLAAAGNGAKHLFGANTYAGPTTISGNGALLFGTRASLYGGDPAQWTEANLTVNAGSGAGFRVGGDGQFTAADLDVLLPLGSGFGGFLAGSRVVLDTTDSDFAYGGAITDPNFGGNSRGLAKNGPNTLTLSGANSYTGSTAIGGGTLTFTRPAALYGGNVGSWTEANLSVAAGATAGFRVGGTDGFSAADITLLASLGTGTTATGFQSGSRIGIDTTDAGGSFSYSDSLVDPDGGSRSLGLAKLGPGTLVLAGDNSYTGGTLVAAGTLQLASASALGATLEPLTVDGGVLDLAGYSVKSSGLDGLAGSITNSSAATPATLTVTVASGTMTYGGSLDDAVGTLALVKLGGGDLLLTGASSFSGGTQTAGDIRIAQASSLGTGPIIATGPAARIYWDGADPSVTFANPLVTGSDLSMALAFAPGNDRTVVLTGPISGSGQIKISASATGTLDLTNQTAATNTNTGGVEVGTGRVLIDAGENLGSGAVNFGTASNSTLVVAGADVAVANPITIGSTASTGSGTAIIDTAGNSLTLLGGIAERSGNDPGSLEKLGAGTLRLAAAGTHRGTTAVSAGTLEVAHAAALGSSGVTVAGPGLLALPPDVRLTPSITSLALDTAGGASVDLGAGQLSIPAGGITAADLRADLIAGRNGGAWNGSAGIMSSTAATAGGTRAVGYVVAGDGSARVSFSAAGDVDLSGQVNVFDLVSINSAGKYGTGGASVWSQGDFNYDGVTNVFDLVGINTAAIYGQGNYFPAGPTAAGSGSLAAVPEPTSWTMLVLTAGLAALACRRGTGARGKRS
jgi:fibronectin-binding autotransporter adhesin